ncbi:hypothetical protein [Actinocorallia longicatena]|uniref:Uncharacterized protein n=1 Tax=Actinocorallia longicatena TaxID=111803 RepID=A0ABP6Q8R8_9ACTN
MTAVLEPPVILVKQPVPPPVDQVPVRPPVEPAKPAVLMNPPVAVRPDPVRPVPALAELEARRLVLEAWREARLSSPSGRVHFLTTIDTWLSRGWGLAFYAVGAHVTVYSCGHPDALLPRPPRRLARPRGAGRLTGLYLGEPLFPGDKSDYQVGGVRETGGLPFVSELAIGVHGDDLHLMPYDEALDGVRSVEAAFTARTYGEARDLGLDVDDRRRCLDYYVQLVCRAHEDVDEQFLRARSTQDLWKAVRPADDQPFDLDEHPCYGETLWRPVPTVRGPWVDAGFRERFGTVDRDWRTGLERLPGEHANDVLAHLRDHGWSVARDDGLFAAYWPDS